MIQWNSLGYSADVDYVTYTTEGAFSPTELELPEKVQQQDKDLTQIFVAPDGSDDNPGTIELPLRSLQKAQESASAGDTVCVRGGLYEIGESQISQVVQGLFACVTYLEKSGTDGNTIKYWAYPGENANF